MDEEIEQKILLQLERIAQSLEALEDCIDEDEDGDQYFRTQQ